MKDQQTHVQQEKTDSQKNNIDDSIKEKVNENKENVDRGQPCGRVIKFVGSASVARLSLVRIVGTDMAPLIKPR